MDRSGCQPNSRPPSAASSTSTLFKIDPTQLTTRPPSVASSTSTLDQIDPTADTKANPAVDLPTPKGFYSSFLQSAKTYYSSRVAGNSVFSSVKAQIQAFKNARAGKPIDDIAPTNAIPGKKGIYRSYLHASKDYFTSRVEGKSISESFKDYRQTYKNARAGTI